MGSAKSRKVSTQSLASVRSAEDSIGAPGGIGGGGDGDGGDISDNEPLHDASPPEQTEAEEQDYSTYMPWIKVGTLCSGGLQAASDDPAVPQQPQEDD